MAGPDLIATFGLTLRQPRQAARRVIGWPLASGERWAILALMAVGSTLSAEVFVALAPDSCDPSMALILGIPFAFAALQLAGLAVMTGLIVTLGRQFGGTGSFHGGLAIMGWMQAILLVLQMAQVLALVLVPSLAVVIGLGSLVLTLWLMPNFIAELHGFRSAFLTLLGMIATLFALVLILSLVLIFAFGLGF